MKMSLNFKFLYNYFTPLFFESCESGVSKLRKTFRNQTASIILIYVQRFGRYEILVKKAPLIKNDGR
jgi:hypothetical protein